MSNAKSLQSGPIIPIEHQHLYHNPGCYYHYTVHEMIGGSWYFMSQVARARVHPRDMEWPADRTWSVVNIIKHPGFECTQEINPEAESRGVLPQLFRYTLLANPLIRRSTYP